jgi:hypothetical protein
MSNAQGCQCGQAHSACTMEFQYAVKLVGGQANVATSPFPPFPPAAVGKYWTAINIHNPDKCKKAAFRVKIAVAGALKAGPVSVDNQGPYYLGPDEAFEIDSPDIIYLWSLFFPGQSAPTFVKGYFVIESDIELDVVAVYTAAAVGNQVLTTFQTERVQPRCVPVCEDLVLPLHTGIAAWQTVAPTPGYLGPVALVSPLATGPGGWMNPPPMGSAWVSQLATDGGPGAATLRSYQLCFELCSGFDRPAPFQIEVLTDGMPSPVFINNNQIGAGAGWTTPTTITVPPNHFQAGTNCFRIDVTNVTSPPNQPNPTGFAVAGILRIARGKCPCVPLPLLPTPTLQGATGTQAATLSEQLAAIAKGS